MHSTRLDSFKFHFFELSFFLQFFNNLFIISLLSNHVTLSEIPYTRYKFLPRAIKFSGGIIYSKSYTNQLPSVTLKWKILVP